MLRVRPRFHLPTSMRTAWAARRGRSEAPDSGAAPRSGRRRAMCSTGAAGCFAPVSPRWRRATRRLVQALGARRPRRPNRGPRHAGDERPEGRQDGRRRPRRDDDGRHAACSRSSATRIEVSLATLSRRAGRVERWQRIAVASVKQCGRAVVPAYRARLAGRTGSDARPPAPRCWCWSSRRPDARSRAVRRRAAPGRGQSASSVPKAAGRRRSSGVASTVRSASSLGGRTLRADAAPLVALAALFEAWHAWWSREAV